MKAIPIFALLLLGAAVLSVPPAKARAGLLLEGSRPPVFALPDQAGKSISLSTLLGPRRIVLLFGPRQADLNTIQASHTPFADRDLTILVVVPPGSPLTAAPSPIHLLIDADGKIAQKYGASHGKLAFYLIGKDGHIAMARRTFPTPQTLFGVIDTMPMRRQEMRERGH